MSSSVRPIRSITRGLACLQTPPNVPRDEIWRYGLGFPFQVSPTHAAILANIHRKMAPTEDFEVGADVIVFDDLRRLIPDRAVPITRPHREINPRVGEMAEMLKGPPLGGFVPLGAKRPDGSPHPHAGTGFGCGLALAYHIDDGDRSKLYGGCYRNEESYLYREMFQFSFDGTTFCIAKTEPIPMDKLLPGYLVQDIALRMAIPDGDDLLTGATVGFAGATEADVMAGTEQHGCGVLRWRRLEGNWRPVAFTPVAMEFACCESSLVRDVDGSLLFSVRPEYNVSPRNDVVIWRSGDNVASWQKIIHVKNLRYRSPITLDTAADGTPYIVCNHYLSAPMNYEGSFMDGFGRTTSREMIALWPLNANRNGLLSPLVAAFPRYEFGPPPVYEGPQPGVNVKDPGAIGKGRDWTVDHPNSMTVRLADGQWHNLLCHRRLAQAEVQGPILPTPHSGLCVEEVFSAGPARPEWNF